VRRAFTPSDVVSLLRVPLALLFVGLFRREPGTLLTGSIIVAGVAQATDHLDGYLARQTTGGTVAGWLFDSVADRAFYIAAVIAFDREYGLGWFLVWSFTFREICLYAVRVGVGDFARLVPEFRKLALIHAGVVRLGIVIGCLLPYRVLPAALDNTTFLWAIFIAATAFGYLCLYALFKALR
jgi:phosphatidylglycerophosphate synthase